MVVYNMVFGVLVFFYLHRLSAAVIVKMKVEATLYHGHHASLKLAEISLGVIAPIVDTSF